MSYLGPSLRRTARRTRRAWRRVLVALVLSLLVNALVLEQMNAHWRVTPVAIAPKRDVVLAPLSASEWEANRAIGRSQLPNPSQSPTIAQSPPPPAPPPPRNMPGQVVDVAPSKNDTPPKDSRFVSERNNTVEKETRSRDARAGYENTLAKKSSPDAAKEQPTPPAPPAVASAPPAEKQGGQASGKGARGGPASPTVPPPSPAARDRLALLDRGELRNPLKAPVPPVTTPRTGEGGPEDGDGRPRSPGTEDKGEAGTRGPIGRLDLRPSASALEKLAGGPAPDRLEGVEEGEGTFLNTREWKYAGYFNRIKQAVASQWDPSTAMVARDPNGSRFSHKDWDTLVMVRLDSAGVLKKVTVARGSGLEFLDRLAVEAFEKAQPFANPPPGLADDRGEIAFSFGFYVQMGGSGMRVFRQQR